MDWVSIDSHDASARRDPVGQELDDSARTAAQIDRASSRPQVDPVEEFGAVRTELIGLALQPGALRRIAAQRVDGGGRWLCSRGGDRRVFGFRHAELPQPIWRW